MYLYDENGNQIKGSCMALGREGAIEIMNSSYGVAQNTCHNTGKLMGSRQHNAFTLHKEIDKQQKELCRMHGSGEYSISDLAELLSVSQPTVYRTLSRGE